ncbi:MAG: sporulation protein YunB [Roseburia sp.]|nr:sporulation protein YunB [Anaeroplasma bactoclasticum]MCM1196554.1 sporulation protein YunB [Roseburia sp.]MCM1557623.1 sporulation protein YunB [Anaeroplasma bactoclasticum]
MKHLKRFAWRFSFLILFILLIVYVCKFSMSYFSEAMDVYTESLVIGYATEVIDEGITEGVVELLDGKSVLCESYDSTGKVSYAYLDVKTINYLRNNISRYIASCVDIINKGEKFSTVDLPLGYFFGLNYFFSKGLRVPIHLEVVGNQDVVIEKSIESYGLNTTVLQINMIIAINIRSVIPFQTNTVQTKISIPVALEILNNDIPYYLGMNKTNIS